MFMPDERAWLAYSDSEVSETQQVPKQLTNSKVECELSGGEQTDYVKHDTVLNQNSDSKIRQQEKRKESVPLWERKIFTVPVKSTWPAPVSCKMNIEEWKILMKETGLERDVEYIVNSFENGFCLGVPQHDIEGMKWYTPPNHKSAILAKEKIELTLEKEREAGQIAGPFTHEEVYAQFGFFRSNPMGVRLMETGP